MIMRIHLTGEWEWKREVSSLRVAFDINTEILKMSGSHPSNDEIMSFPDRELYCRGYSLQRSTWSKRGKCVWSGMRLKWDGGAGRNKTVRPCQPMLWSWAASGRSRRVMLMGLHCKRMTGFLWGPNVRRQYRVQQDSKEVTAVRHSGRRG